MNMRIRRDQCVRAASIALIFLCGCGGSPLPSASEPEEAKRILISALDAWKKGEKPDALASASPSVRVLDREWGDGFTLTGYELQGQGNLLGLNVQQAVALQLKNLKGKPLKKTVNYVVTTGPQPVVARQDIDE